jgi:hypothetical protein
MPAAIAIAKIKHHRNIPLTAASSYEARRLFAEVAKAPWKKGKQPNRSRNDQLLEMYDSAVREAPDRIRSIPRLLARQLHPNNPRSPPATEKQIRRLARDRSRRQRAMEEAYRRFPRTLLGSSDGDI